MDDSSLYCRIKGVEVITPMKSLKFSPNLTPSPLMEVVIVTIKTMIVNRINCLENHGQSSY